MPCKSQISHLLKLPVAALCLFVFSASAEARGFLDFESGAAFTGYNDVRIPSDTGTKISLKDDVAAQPALALRFRGGYTFNDRHTVLVLAAPLTVRSSGTLERDISYQGKTFAKGTQVESTYRFDSYRLTYRYSFINSDSLILAAGVTGKVRSADIAVMSDTGFAQRSDLGVVPLISFMVQWNFAKPFSALLDVDALWSPYGRAEDALFALQYHPADNVAVRLGYRVLEGGAGGSGSGNVYTSSLFHYAIAGITVRF